MEKLIIAKLGVAYAGTRSATTTAEGAVTPDLLAEGAFGIYGYHRYSDGFEKFALITHTAATANTAGAYKAKDTDFNGDEIVFYLGANSSSVSSRFPGVTPAQGVSQPRQSQPIQLLGVTRILGQPYVAAVKGVWTITPPALPTTGTAYDEYVLHITKTPSTKVVESWTFSIQGIFGSLDAMTTAMVAAINARGNIPFTAADSSGTIVITALNFAQTFSFGFDGFLYPSTVVVTTAMVRGNGMLYQIGAKEANTLGEQGFLDQIDRRVIPIDSLAAEDEYDTYILDFRNSKKLKDETDDSFSNRGSLLVCVPQGSGAALVLEMILGTLHFPITPILPAEAGGTTTSTTTVAPAP